MNERPAATNHLLNVAPSPAEVEPLEFRALEVRPFSRPVDDLRVFPGAPRLSPVAGVLHLEHADVEILVGA